MTAPQNPNQPQQPPGALAGPEPTIAIGGPGAPPQPPAQGANPDATQVVRPGENDQPEATQVVRPGQVAAQPSGQQPVPQAQAPQAQAPQAQQATGPQQGFPQSAPQQSAPQPQPGYGQPTPPPGYPQQPQPGYGQPPGYPPPGFGQQLGQQPPPPGYPPQGYQQPGYSAAPYQYGGAYQYASWGQRFVGGLIDYGSIGVVNGIILGIAFGAEIYALAGLGSLAGLFFLFYNICYLGGTKGQTWGKKVAGIKVVREDSGQVIGFGLAFGRQLLHIVDALPIYIGFLAPLWDAKRQTWSDKIVNTIVIEAPAVQQGYPAYGQQPQYGQPPQQW